MIPWKLKTNKEQEKEDKTSSSSAVCALKVIHFRQDLRSCESERRDHTKAGTWNRQQMVRGNLA